MEARKRVLFFPFPLLSHYLRCLQLADAIRDEYEILFAASVKYNHWVKQSGFELFECENFNAGEVMDQMARFNFTWLNGQDIERIFLSEVAAMKKYKPAFIIGDTMSPVKMAAEKTGVTYISLQNGYLAPYYKLYRNLSRTHYMFPYLHWLPSALLNPLTAMGERRSFKQLHKPFNKLRMKYGLGKKHTYSDELEGDYTLLCDLPEIFPQRQLPDNYSIIGPLFHRGNEAETEVIERINNGRGTILVTTGSADSPGKMDLLKDACFSRFNILIAGNKNFLPGQDNVIYRRFFNLSAVLPYAGVTICHGGNGTIYQSLAEGVPVLCLPTHVEQEWNVHRISALGLGADLSHICSAKELALHVEKWIGRKSSPAVKEIATKISVTDTKNNFRRIMLERITSWRSSKGWSN